MKKYISLLLVLIVNGCAKENPKNIPSITNYQCTQSTEYYSYEYGCHERPKVEEQKEFSGKVLDENNKPISGVKISGKNIISSKDNLPTLQDFLLPDIFTNDDGSYFIKNINVDYRVEITASKDNWKIAKILYPTLINNPLLANIDFYRFTDKLIYTSMNNKISKINKINADGSEKISLSEDGLNSIKPVLSPDGNKIAYITQIDGNNILFTVNLDGSDRKKVYTGMKDSLVSWSPDSNKLLFESKSNDINQSQIITINSDGTGAIYLTELSDMNHNPKWPPDGRKIIYVEEKDNKSNITLMNSDGSDKVIISSKDGYGNFKEPQWSPDSKKIMFLNSNNKITIINSDGTNEIIISEYINGLPRWSHDSKKIVLAIRGDEKLIYSDGTRVNSGIYIINSDGKNKTLLETNQSFKTSPNFSPDDKKISFVSNLDGSNEVYIMKLEGSNDSPYGSNFQRIVHDPTNNDSDVLFR